MSKMILSLDGGGIRGAASARFLELVEERLVAEGTSLRGCVDFYAGTSTGSIIALALATTDLPMREISGLYNHETAVQIFVPRCWMLPRLGGYLSPKYKAGGKVETLKRHLGDAKLEDVGTSKHVLAVSYDIGKRKPDVIKSTDDEQRKLFSWQVADVSSAAPTYFPTRELREGAANPDEWLVDGGVTANNPTMCVIAEAKRVWPEVSIDEMRVLSVGTGYRSQAINGPASRRWGGIQWFTKGHILDVLTDERVVAYQAITLMKQGTYIRVNANMVRHRGLPNPPDDEMDDINPANIEKLRAMGKWWFEQYGTQAVDLLLGRYTGPSLDRIEIESGAPRPFAIRQSA
ncbi:MAG TPA: patatin-like phospholipase family protein [Mariprofundaceae bacterium]|nr:patatin-like phospholipase family protein [Mariprofundaceae bacterium]